MSVFTCLKHVEIELIIGSLYIIGCIPRLRKTGTPHVDECEKVFFFGTLFLLAWVYTLRRILITQFLVIIIFHDCACLVASEYDFDCTLIFIREVTDRFDVYPACCIYNGKIS